MDVIDRINELLAARGESGAEMSRALGLSNSIYSQWNTRKTKPSNRTLVLIAKYLDTTTDYLRFGTEQNEKTPTLTKKDERDIEKRLESVLEELEDGQGGLAFSGEPMDDETRELLIKSLRNSMEVGKALAKKKYTPKKYRKE